VSELIPRGVTSTGLVRRAAVTLERTRIVVVAGRAATRRRIGNALTQAGFEVFQESSCQAAWRELARLRPHLVLLDEPVDDFHAEDLRGVAVEPDLGAVHVVLAIEVDRAGGTVGHGLPEGIDSVLVRPYSDLALLVHMESMASIQRHAVAIDDGRRDLVEARRVALSMMQDAETQRQRAEEAHELLKASTQSLRLLSRAIETSPVVVVIADREGVIEYANPHATTVTGYRIEELVGNHTRIFKSGRQSPEFYAELWATLNAGRQWSGEFCNRRKDGSLFWESASIAPVHDDSGLTTHFVAVKEDITGQRRITREIEEAKEKAEAANKAKSDFMASMSHELRTPLTAIIGFSQVLQDRTFGELTPKQDRYVGNVVLAGEHLLSLISDLLDLAKVEAGRTELEVSTVRIRTLAANSVMIIRDQAMLQGLTVHVEVPDDLVIRADERRLMQVLFNLLSNALKFTPGPGGAVFLSAVRAGDDVQVSVRDSGCGIELEDQPRLFARFEQLHSGYGREHGGTGLGLALSRGLVEAHGGRIWVVSEGRGKGAAFHFTIPAKLPDSLPILAAAEGE
jgi:PAS domain S-box-containing protein